MLMLISHQSISILQCISTLYIYFIYPYIQFPMLRLLTPTYIPVFHIPTYIPSKYNVIYTYVTSTFKQYVILYYHRQLYFQ